MAHTFHFQSRPESMSSVSKNGNLFSIYLYVTILFFLSYSFKFVSLFSPSSSSLPFIIHLCFAFQEPIVHFNVNNAWNSQTHSCIPSHIPMHKIEKPFPNDRIKKTHNSYPGLHLKKQFFLRYLNWSTLMIGYGYFFGGFDHVTHHK